MKRSLILITFLSFLLSSSTLANRLIGIQVVDKDYLMLHFRDGEVRYRDDATGPSAYLGHSFTDGDDTLLVFGPRLDAALASQAALWQVSSPDDKSYPLSSPKAIYRKSKPMNTDHTLTSELDHWLFLQLPQSMRQGCTYQVNVPEGLGSDQTTASVKYDIWTSQSEAVHVNILGYSPAEAVKAADLYMWLGDGGQRDYKAFEGKKVWLYNVNTRRKQSVGTVRFWLPASASTNEAGRKNLVGSDVWNVDFKVSAPGRYRLVVVIDAHILGLRHAEQPCVLSAKDAGRVDVVYLPQEVLQVVMRNPLGGKRDEVLPEGLKLVFHDVGIQAEVRLIELPEAVLFVLHLPGRLEDGEAVLRYEGFVFPRLVLLVAESGNRSSRHAKHQNGYGYSGKQDAIEIFSHA